MTSLAKLREELLTDLEVKAEYDRLGPAISLEELRRLWREGVDSGECAPPDADDIKRRGRERLAASEAASRRPRTDASPER